MFGGIPFADEIRMAGGLVCQWSDGINLDGVESTAGTGVRELGHTTTYTAPTYATPMKPTCGTTIRPAVWRAAVGASAPVAYFTAPPGYDTVTYAMNQTRAFFCAADDLAGTGNAGLLQDLPGGRWSFLILRPILTTPGPLTPISVPGMRAGDTAFTRCDPTHRHCILDALIATHWIQVDLLPATMGGTLIRNDRLNAMTPLLTEIVQQVYTP